MNSLYAVLVMTAVAVSPVLAADRLTDRDLKALVARIEDGRDRFDDALDSRLKRSIIRGERGEVDVDQFLNDFQENIDRLEERLKPDYAASAEVAAVLRQATEIERYFRAQPAGTRGESEWNRLAADLKVLAAAYGAGFPLSENATVRRMGDGEVAAAADALARAAQTLKKSLDQDLKKQTSVDKPTREGIAKEADQLSKDAKVLRERVKDAEPSSAEADRVLERAQKLQAFIQSHDVPGAAASWQTARARLADLAAAYGRTWPGR